MLKNPKAKGSRLERKVRDELKARGCFVLKAGGSLGEWDLVALADSKNSSKESLPIVVQVKSNRMPSKKEMAILKASTVVAEKWIAIVHDRKGIEWIDL